jgi:hypothetical protein
MRIAPQERCFPNAVGRSLATKDWFAQAQEQATAFVCNLALPPITTKPVQRKDTSACEPLRRPLARPIHSALLDSSV